MRYSESRLDPLPYNKYLTKREMRWGCNSHGDRLSRTHNRAAAGCGDLKQISTS